MTRLGPIAGMGMTLLRTLLRDARGATAVEYGLICALIVIASMGGMSFFGKRTLGMYNGIASNVSNVM